MKQFLIKLFCLASASLFSIIPAKFAFGFAGAAPTGGLSFFSTATGVVGAGVGTFSTNPSRGFVDRAFLAVGGLSIFILDPETATFINGKIVIDYPDSLLAVDSITWFGEFAENPSLPFPPVEPTGFIQTKGTYQLQQPNPALNVSVTNSNSILTIEFDASPSGIVVESEDSFNVIGILFQNISGKNLVFEEAESSPNLFQIPSEQTLICIPPEETIPVTCGQDSTKNFKVTSVPESTSIFGLLTLSVLGAGSSLLYKKKFKEN